MEAECIIEAKIEKFIEAYLKDSETPSPLGDCFSIGNSSFDRLRTSG